MKAVLNEMRDDLIENYKNGTLYEYIFEMALSIEKRKNKISHILFTYGGPNILLDITGEHRGCICGYWGSTKVFSQIPWSIWEDIELEILDMFGELES